MPVRELAAEIKVNPMTISKAYSLLEHDGYVRRERGIGLFVTRPKQEIHKKAKKKIITELLDKAAIRAIQLEVSIEECIETLNKLFETYQQNSKK